MPSNNRFTVAVHVLAYLALRGSELVTSDELAKSVRTNAVVIRRVVSALNKAGLVEAHAGLAGGSTLARSAAKITLLDVARAIETSADSPLYHRPPNADCPVGKRMEGILRGYIDRIETAKEKALKSVSLSDIVHDVRTELAQA